jgi:hypothetical protein
MRQNDGSSNIVSVAYLPHDVRIPGMEKNRFTHAQLIEYLEAALAKAKEPTQQWEGHSEFFSLLMRVGEGRTLKVVVQ